jgi:hypothetical protein
MNDDPLSPEEQARLARARVPIAPPAGEEDRLVAALRQRGLVRPRRGSAALAWLAVAALAAIVVIAVVWMLR